MAFTNLETSSPPKKARDPNTFRPPILTVIAYAVAVLMAIAAGYFCLEAYEAQNRISIEAAVGGALSCLFAAILSLGIGQAISYLAQSAHYARLSYQHLKKPKE